MILFVAGLCGRDPGVCGRVHAGRPQGYPLLRLHILQGHPQGKPIANLSAGLHFREKITA